MRRPFGLALVSLAAACAGTHVAPAPPCPRQRAAPIVARASPSEDAGARASPAPFEPSPWLEDLHALIEAMSSHYANLDYAVRDRGMDLAALRARTEARLRAAKSEDEAKRAFRGFLNAFGDAHLAIDWSPAKPSGEGERRGPLCARLGYAARDSGGVQWSDPGISFTRVDDADAADFPGGVVTLPGGGKLGVLRIALFMETAHPALCEAARAAQGLADDAACDERCEERLELEVANRLTAALERRLAAIARAGAQALAIDITGNGGGSNWVEPAVRVVTPAHLRVGTIGAVRHQHWVKDLQDHLRSLETCADSAGPARKPILDAAARTLRAEIAEVGTPCDQRALWEEGRPKPTCTQLVRIAPVLAYAKPGELRGVDCAGDLFGPSRYEYHEGASTLPLVVLVDGNTASAAEDFVEVLQDQRAALVVGSTTLGAGCGFTNGGIPTVLPRSGARVKLPDCARLRADGTNAVAGVTPDVVLPLLDRDSPHQRAQKTIAGLAAAWPRIVAR